MSREWEQKTIEEALRQRIGMSAERSAALSEKLNSQTDWYTTCPRCQQYLRGSPIQLREHRCGN